MDYEGGKSVLNYREKHTCGVKNIGPSMVRTGECVP